MFLSAGVAMVAVAVLAFAMSETGQDVSARTVTEAAA
jgi:hypothetical protein